MLTDEQLKEWRKLADEATGGEWKNDIIYPYGGGRPYPGIRAMFKDDDWSIVCVDAGKNNAAFIIAARTAVPALLDEVKRLRVEHVHADALANDMAVIQDAIAIGFWNIEDIWVHIKTDEGDELARNVQQLWQELMWADFIRSSAHDHWDGFTFTTPPKSTPDHFFRDGAREAMEAEFPYVDAPQPEPKLKVGDYVFAPHRKTFGIIADIDPESAVNIAIRWIGDGMKLWYADTELFDLKRVEIRD